MPDDVAPEEPVRRALNEFLDHLIRLVLTKPDTQPPTQAQDAPAAASASPAMQSQSPGPNS